MSEVTMRLSCGDHSFQALPHAAAIDLIAKLGFDGLDLMLHGNRSHVRPEAIRNDVPEWAGRLEERVRAHGLELSDVFLIPWTDFETMAPNHPDAAERERGARLFADMLELAARVGASGMTTLPGIDWPHETHEESLERAAAELGARAAAAAERGLRFSVEPHVGSVCGTPADAARLCELAPAVELTLDYTHFVAVGIDEDEIEPLLARTRQFHARGGAMGRMQTPLTENTIDYERAIDGLREVGYDGFVSVEYVWADSDRLNELDIASETVLMRDRLRAKLAGETWTLPELP